MTQSFTDSDAFRSFTLGRNFKDGQREAIQTALSNKAGGQHIGMPGTKDEAYQAILRAGWYRFATAGADKTLGSSQPLKGIAELLVQLNQHGRRFDAVSMGRALLDVLATDNDSWQRTKYIFDQVSTSGDTLLPVYVVMERRGPRLEQPNEALMRMVANVPLHKSAAIRDNFDFYVGQLPEDLRRAAIDLKDRLMVVHGIIDAYRNNDKKRAKSRLLKSGVDTIIAMEKDGSLQSMFDESERMSLMKAMTLVAEDAKAYKTAQHAMEALKSGKDARIAKLTAANKELEARIAELEAQLAAKDPEAETSEDPDPESESTGEE
jgi:uncharacterized protein YdcH (DUF465 family)